MEWSHEFCLSCDRQITEGGAYCSQACRLADLEKAGTTTSQSSSNLSSSASSTSSSTHGFYLPPAVNFVAFKTPTSSRGFDLGPSNSYNYAASNSSYYAPSHAAASSTSSPSQGRSLSPSSSRSSLSSASSQPTTSGISPQAAQQLNSYVRSFDNARDVRRMSRRFTQY
ncbi:uncharacterized protein EI97DRAFT_446839 [Westerdykella ornata]|uniref:Life-span regulatory factor domain-containing protein n=1 Tax=Westerdykella ornata TaxID=318751 RepID=A0A6A6JW29_WESOR|nr:uncharacterized protein EI97DRAFT_446839 [Westerdykella ornata]KAF2280607.1 hypothetical protein EI97DRAFT_446839 [Westerdykella ornata]